MGSLWVTYPFRFTAGPGSPTSLARRSTAAPNQRRGGHAAALCTPSPPPPPLLHQLRRCVVQLSRAYPTSIIA